MRAILVIFALVAGGCPDNSVTGGIPPGYEASCAPVAPATLASLAIAHADGRPYVIGDSLDTVRGGQGGTMAHFTLVLGGTVSSCVESEVHVNYATSFDAHPVTLADGGGRMEYYMGPIDTSHVTITATVAGKTATLTAGSTVQSID